MLIQYMVEQCQSHPQPDFFFSDLRQGSDLLLPAALFRGALDTEVIPLIAKLTDQNTSEQFYSANHLKLTQFIRQVCLAYPEVFEDK
ncbi:MAG: hypothetical protein NW220_00645 [Leptolyngbyaceae cyanobacterium bins.349]|nr:hypothetical protein [Leptolyngbyaceae cyanobacterium bins.349]